MKSIKSSLAVLVAGLALFAGMAMAQDQTAPPAGGGNRMHGRPFMGRPGLGMVLEKLNLTAEQKTEIKNIFHSQMATLKPLMQKDRAAQMQIMQLITSGNFNQAQASAILAAQSQNRLQLEMAHAQMASEIFTKVLTSEQQSQAKELVAEHVQRMQQRFQKNGESAPPNE